MKRLLILAATALLLAGCAGTPSSTPSAAPQQSQNDYTAPPNGPGTTSPTPSPTQTTATALAGHTIGEAVKVDQGGGNAAQVTIVSASYVPNLNTGSYTRTPTKGGFLVLEILWETTAGTSSPNPFYFNMRDAAGHTGSMAIGTDDDLHSVTLPAGDKVAGKVAYDIAPGPWRLTVSAGGSAPMFWNIPAA